MRLINIEEVAKSGDLRIDPHHFLLRAVFDQVASDITGGIALASPGLRDIRNGENLAASLYVRDGESSDTLYASVGALSQFAFRFGSCTPLKTGVGGLSQADVARLKCRSDEVLITRSGTPGIAWSPALLGERTGEQSIIPSGFLIRCVCSPDRLNPRYVAAVLNHPIWRLWTASLAAGKRQRNLSQEHLATILLPPLSAAAQAQAGDAYADALRDVEQIHADSHLLDRLCDAILLEECALVAPLGPVSTGVAEQLTLASIAASTTLRIDHRHLRRDRVAVMEFTRAQPGGPFGALIDCVIRNGQPTILAVDDGEPPRVIATGSIQLGQIDEANTKPTQFSDLASAAKRFVAMNDVLIAMDGEGSVGKAAVFDGNYDAVCDSHVAIFRLKDPRLAWAIACFLNSTLGQHQLSRHISGATGQVQINAEDVLSTWIPTVVVEEHDNVGSHYVTALQTYEGVIGKVRRRICLASVDLSEVFLKSSCFGRKSKSFIERYQSADELYTLISMLKPKMF